MSVSAAVHAEAVAAASTTAGRIPFASLAVSPPGRTRVPVPSAGFAGAVRWPVILGVIAAHASVALALLSMEPVVHAVGMQQPLMASLIVPPTPVELPASAKAIEPPKPLPQRPRTESSTPIAPHPPRLEPPATSPPPLLSVQESPSPVAIAPPPTERVPAPEVLPPPVQPAPEGSVPVKAAVTPAHAVPSAPSAPQVEAVAAPRFDADYLDNPVPVYPPLSRRLGEQGRVLLRVYVLADGRAGEVDIRESSGFERLDRAAREAVARWRFVPARQGERPVAAWVLVPISFSLRS